MRVCVCVRLWTNFGQIGRQGCSELGCFWENIAGYNVFKGNKDSVTVLWDHS